MSKDPATLWYWNDFLTGVMTFSRHQIGCYIILLGAQHNNGRLSLDEIKTILGSDFGTAWPALQKKFEKDESGLYFNRKAEEVKNKRSAYTKSRRDNLSKSLDKDKPMGDHMENENVIGNESSTEKKEHLLQLYVGTLKNVSGMKEQLTFEECEKLLKDFTKEKIQTMLLNMENRADLQKKNRNVNLTLRNWLRRETNNISAPPPGSPHIVNGFPNYYDQKLYQKLSEGTNLSKLQKYQEHLRANGYKFVNNEWTRSIN